MEHPPELPEDMAAVVANSPPPPQQQPQSGPKRYRPAPAKTFQCRGYGECRMVFSRSEHLARHIRKHTGERPFTCHCSKQFSRLDNLRQHAQTVHADKQDQNERMMRDLTSLHASMAAANKLATVRNPRRNPPSHAVPVKQEDLPHPLLQRPGTSTGYEGDHDSFLYPQQYTHSFRDSSQSFLGPPATPTAPAAGAAPGQSFLPFSSSLGFSVSDTVRDTRPRTSSSRPPTAGGLADLNSRSLPPLSAVVSASLSNSPRQQLIQSFPAPPGSSHGQSGGGSLLLPGSLTLRRPTTATRPGTAPASASLYSAKPPFSGGSGLGFSRAPDLSLQSYGSSGRPSSSLLGPPSQYDPEPPSPGNDPSPFFFSPPGIDPPVASTTATSPASVNHRKRPFPGSDGPYDDSTSSRESASQQQHDYEYGSESRPQSRRLSVMELCNDDNDNTSSGPPATFLLSSSTRPAAAESRPTTSALISSASALALVDRPSPTLSSPSIQPRPSSQYPTTNSRGNGSSGNGGSSEEFGGDRVSTPTAFRRTGGIPSHPTAILSSYRTTGGGGGYYYAHSPTTTTTFSTGAPSAAASFSPRSERASTSGSVSPFSPRSPLSSGTADPTSSISRRSAHSGSSDDDQIRDRFTSRTSHPSSALGLRA